MQKPLSIMAIPADEHRADNPYNYILNSSLREQGVNVFGYSAKRFFKADFDILHLHWPENFLVGKRKFGTIKAFIGFWLKMFYVKLRGKKIVWTVHNLSAHEVKYPAVMNFFYRLLYRFMDGFITLTKHGAKEVAKKGVPSNKIAVVPHPHYSGYYPNGSSKAEARGQLQIPSDKFVVLFAGQVRKYKNVVGLVKAFRELNDENSLLVIAGKIHPDVKDELSETINNASNILLFPRFIADEDLHLFLNSADLVVTPFNKVLNSGSVFLNLSFGKPTLVPQTESLVELQEQVGNAWIKTFTGSLAAEHLQKSKVELKEQQLAGQPSLSLFEWTEIAKATKDFYQKIAAGKKAYIEKETGEDKHVGTFSPVKTKTFTAS